MKEEKTVGLDEHINGGEMQDPAVTEEKLKQANQTISQLEYQVQMMGSQMEVERKSYLEIIAQVNAKYGQVVTENSILSQQ